MRSWDKYCEDTEKAFVHFRDCIDQPAYIKGYTDCMCDDDEGDTQEAQGNELADKYNELADKYNAIMAGPFIITSQEPNETRIHRKLFI